VVDPATVTFSAAADEEIIARMPAIKIMIIFL
jgi:hypothetical protein